MYTINLVNVSLDTVTVESIAIPDTEQNYL